MSELTEMVREGLINKIEGITTALLFVKDARELERLQKELKEAQNALTGLNSPVSRSAEEIAELEKMISDTAEVEVPKVAWSDMTPLEKFEYQIELYYDKLDKALNESNSHAVTLKRVVNHLVKTKGDSAVFMNPVIEQFKGSLAEVNFSISKIKEQIRNYEAVKVILSDGDFFEKLTTLNEFLNNPMSLPHLTEKREKELEALSGEKK